MRRALTLVMVVCSLMCGTTAIAQKKNAESLEAIQKRIDADLAAERKRRGFPPEDDLVGTALHCEKVIKDLIAKVDECVVDHLKQLISNRTDSAETVADAVIGGCREPFHGITTGVIPYCMSLEGARRATNELVTARRQFAITAIVRYRTRPDTKRSFSPH